MQEYTFEPEVVVSCKTEDEKIIAGPVHMFTASEEGEDNLLGHLGLELLHLSVDSTNKCLIPALRGKKRNRQVVTITFK